MVSVGYWLLTTRLDIQGLEEERLLVLLGSFSVVSRRLE